MKQGIRETQRERERERKTERLTCDIVEEPGKSKICRILLVDWRPEKNCCSSPKAVCWQNSFSFMGIYDRQLNEKGFHML
jgi:hypothetical protein